MSESNTEAGFLDEDFMKSMDSLRLDECSTTYYSERDMIKKSVSFCRMVSKATFRKDSTIKSTKNARKRARKKAKEAEHKSQQRTTLEMNQSNDANASSSDDSDDKTETEMDTDADSGIALDSRVRQDSGYDSEDIVRDFIASGMFDDQPIVTEAFMKTGKKRKRKRKNRKWAVTAYDYEFW